MEDERGKKSFLQQRLSACNPSKKSFFGKYKISIASSHLQSTKKANPVQCLFISKELFLFGNLCYVQCFRIADDE